MSEGIKKIDEHVIKVGRTLSYISPVGLNMDTIPTGALLFDTDVPTKKMKYKGATDWTDLTPEDIFGTEFISSTHIKDSSIFTNHIKDRAVTGIKIALNTITAENMHDNAIEESAISANAITETKIFNNAISENKYKDLSITSGKLKDGCIVERTINNSAVSYDKLSLDVKNKIADPNITLSDSVSSDSSAIAASSLAVKTVNDIATLALTKINNHQNYFDNTFLPQYDTLTSSVNSLSSSVSIHTGQISELQSKTATNSSSINTLTNNVANLSINEVDGHLRIRKKVGQLQEAGCFYVNSPGQQPKDLSTTLYYNGIFTSTRVYNAHANDIAELFDKINADEVIVSGDIIGIDNEGKITKVSNDNKEILPIGVCSHEFGTLLGITENNVLEDGSLDLSKVCPVSLCGRVYTKVNGRCNRGDYIISSDYEGVGTSLSKEDFYKDPSSYNLVGIALEDCMDYNISNVRILIK